MIATLQYLVLAARVRIVGAGDDPAFGVEDQGEVEPTLAW